MTSDPVITVHGANPKVVAQDATAKYMDDRVTCEDDNDGIIVEITHNATFIDRSQDGTQIIEYTCKDDDGNMDTAIRAVEVTDQAMPVITIFGDNPKTINQAANYTDALASCVDGRDGNDLTVTNNANGIDTSMVGNQTVTYTCTDLEGNKHTEDRIVTVVDVTDPVLVVDPIMDEVSVGSDLTYNYTAVSLALTTNPILKLPTMVQW